jgi:predicted component of type VI protein secretion system
LEDRQSIVSSLQQAVEAFEPRLRNVTIGVDESSIENQAFAVRISGQLVVDPIGEVVSFDSVVPMKPGRARVHGID